MTAWHAGQQVALDRTRIMVIDRVTPTGRAYIGERAFNPDGYERGGKSKGVWGKSASMIEALTPEITEIVQLAERWVSVRARSYTANNRLNIWIRDHCSTYNRNTPKAEIIDIVERITAAINAVLPEVTP